MNNLYMLLYTSLLAPDASPSVVTDIVRTSRVNNRQRDITGILVFDGMAFCQYLEGTAASVAALMDKIRADLRHTDVRILTEGAMEKERKFSGWSLAYGLDNTESLTSLFSETMGAAAVPRFEGLLTYIDREPCI